MDRAKIFDLMTCGRTENGPKEKACRGQPAGSTRGVTVTSTTQPAYITRSKRFRCPVHQGKNLSVAVGYIDGRAWAKCWSQGCAQADILAALGITNDPSIPWTPAPAPPHDRPSVSIICRL